MATTYKRGEHDTRPWGTWEVLDSGENFALKKSPSNLKQSFPCSCTIFVPNIGLLLTEQP